jgi:hypothetical protein
MQSQLSNASPVLNQFLFKILPVSRQPSAVSRQPSAFSRQQSAVSRQPSAISRQPSAFSSQPSALSCPLGISLRALCVLGPLCVIPTILIQYAKNLPKSTNFA